jgi:PleD family two-component response regulator
LGEPGPKFKGKLTASFGVASRDATTTSGLRMVHRADEAMYEAKRSGKDRIVTHRELVARELAVLGAGGLAGLS